MAAARSPQSSPTAPSSFARAHRYTLADRPQVDLVADPTVQRADIRVDARFAEPVAGRAGHGPVDAEHPDRPASPAAIRRTTRVFADPRPSMPAGRLRVTDPDGRIRRGRSIRTGLTIGRADRQRPRRSRRAGLAPPRRIVGRRGTLVYADLGSTNGSRRQRERGHGGRPRRRRPASEIGGYRPRRRGRTGRPTDGRLHSSSCGRSGSCSSASCTCSWPGSCACSLRDLRAAARERQRSAGPPGRSSTRRGEPPAGSSFGLDVITPLGRDVNNAIVIDDPFASADHAVLTYRGRAWYVEDLGSTNGSYVNGHRSRASRRWGSATRSRSARSGCASNGPALMGRPS